MGYTHYSYQRNDCPKDKWEQILRASRKLIEAAPCRLDDETTPSRIMFNGVGANSHETFVLQQKRPAKNEWENQKTYNEKGSFDFCKTARKPYDIVVVAVLAVAKMYAPEVYTIKSDGSPEELREGIEFASKVLGVEVPMPLEQARA